MNPPAFIDGDPVLYHCLTAHKGLTVAGVEDLLGELVLLSPNARVLRYGEGWQSVGIQHVDMAAGDGAAIFFTLGAPIGGRALGTGWWTKAVRDTPCAGFRLSALKRFGDVTVRPTDLQTYYARFVNGPITELENAMGDSDVFWMEVGDRTEALTFIREAIERPASRELVASIIEGEDLSIQCDVSDRDVRREADRAVSGLYETLEAYNILQLDDDDDDIDKWSVEASVDILAETLSEAIFDGCAEWSGSALDRAEGVFWGAGLPLSAASVIVSADRREVITV